MKKLLLLILTLAICLSALVSCGEEDHIFVEMSVVNYGKVVLELDPNAAPITVKNFVDLVEKGFYDGLTFHRIIGDFMIQGGAPEKAADMPPSIKGEFAENGYKGNYISHVKGVISMARSGDPDSASSQFFICNADSTKLDGKYAAFGWVVSGLEVVDKITEDVFPKTALYDYYKTYYHSLWQAYGNGAVENEEDKPVIEYIKVLKNYDPKSAK